MLYKRVGFNEAGESTEPVNFVAVHPLRWDSAQGEPTAAFAEVDDEEPKALRAAGDELAKAMNNLLKNGRWDITAIQSGETALRHWREAIS